MKMRGQFDKLAKATAGQSSLISFLTRLRAGSLVGPKRQQRLGLQIGSKRHKAGLAARGFTIVELLIVVVVIAILAAITIVSYNGIAAQARAAAMRSDVEALTKQIEIFRVENDRYPVLGAELEPILRNAGLFAQAHSEEEKNGFDKKFVFCSIVPGDIFVVGISSDFKGMSSDNRANYNGKMLYWSKNGVMGSAPYVSGANVNVSIDIAQLVYPTAKDGDPCRWSFDVPERLF